MIKLHARTKSMVALSMPTLNKQQLVLVKTQVVQQVANGSI